jgi:septum formation protein
MILASKSPRRRELLHYLGIPFETIPADIDESGDESDPLKMSESVARKKGIFIYRRLERREQFGKSFFPLVIASDTLVFLNNKVYGKPLDRQMAKAMLLELSDNVHHVFTGVSLSCLDINTGLFRSKEFSVVSKVRFDRISEDLLENYLLTGDSLDKAGAYGIQGPSLTFISQIEGSYSNVVGFPLSDFVREIKNFLGYGEDRTGSWRTCINGHSPAF